MAEFVGVQQFAQQIRNEVIDGSGPDEDGHAEADFKENVFTRVVTGYLCDVGAIDDAEVCYFARKVGKANVKVNGYNVDEETKSVDLFVTCYTHAESPSRLTKADVETPLKQVIRFYGAACNGLHEQMEEAHDDFAMVQRLHEASPEVEQIRCFFLTDGISPVTAVKPLVVGSLTARCEIWDIERLYRATQAHTPHETITIDFEKKFGELIKCLDLTVDLKNYKSFVAIIPGAVLSALYDEYGSRLLELNVRSFLQARGKVNKGIRDTLKQAPERFLAYNNGISATAAEVQLATMPSGHVAIRLIRDLQIVNGGQTTASIHRAHKEDKADLTTVFVQAKISVVDPQLKDEFVPLISKFANSQNAVREADFSANDGFHIELERLAENTWCPGEQSRWFYERARGAYQVAKAREGATAAKKRAFNSKCPSSQTFAKTDVAKYSHSWDSLPHLVSRGAQKNFVEFMLRQKELDKDWKPDAIYYKELIAKALVFKEAQRVVRQLKTDIQAYGANVATYAVSLLAFRSSGRLALASIWDSQEVPLAVTEALIAWTPIVYLELIKSADGRNVTEWAKKPECWTYIRSLEFPLAASLESLLSEHQANAAVGRLSARNASSDLSREDADRIARVMQISSDIWFTVSDWGRKTGKLKAWQSGIAHTLSGYASANWEKIPSVKQANQAVKILELVEQTDPSVISP